MAGNAHGALKTAARRVGLSVEAYGEMLARDLKWCYACRAFHPHTAFGVDRARGDGLSARCATSPGRGGDRPGLWARARLADHNLAWCRGCRAWVPISEVTRGDGVCRAHRAAEARGFYARNPQPQRERKRARKRGLARIPVWWAEECRAAFGHLCAYGCGRDGGTWDHIWPVSRGGQSRPGNLVPACISCNSSKKRHHPDPWVDRGLASFPDQWADVLILAMQVGCDYWEYEVAS